MDDIVSRKEKSYLTKQKYVFTVNYKLYLFNDGITIKSYYGLKISSV